MFGNVQCICTILYGLQPCLQLCSCASTNSCYFTSTTWIYVKKTYQFTTVCKDDVMISVLLPCVTQYDLIVVNGQTMTSAFHKVV